MQKLQEGMWLFQNLIIWVFPKIMVPPNHRVFQYKPSFLGYPYFWKHPYIDTWNLFVLYVWASTLQNKAKIPIKNKGHLGSRYKTNGGGLPLVAMSWDAIYVHVFCSFFHCW